MARGPKPFGKYLLLEHISGGGMSEVWRARPRDGTNAVVAIKRILPRMASDPELLTMFLNEARIAAQLAHPNIAQIYDLGRDGEDFFIAFEYIAGTDLRAIFQRSAERGVPMPLPLVAFVVAQVCDALDYAHRKCDASGQPLDIVHRDVSPDNCLVTFDGQVKLIDFGVAKVSTSERAKTRAGVIKGKFAYMSPEQVLGQPLDRRSDLFSLAVVLYEMSVGRRLFWFENQYQSLYAVCRGKIVPPCDANPNVPPELERIILRGLSRDRHQRFQAASEMAEALRAFLAAADPTPSAEQLRQYLAANFEVELARERDRRTAWARTHEPGRKLQVGDSLEGDEDDRGLPTVLDVKPEATDLSFFEPEDKPTLSLPPGALPGMRMPQSLLNAPPAELPPPMPSPKLVDDSETAVNVCATPDTQRELPAARTSPHMRASQTLTPGAAAAPPAPRRWSRGSLKLAVRGQYRAGACTPNPFAAVVCGVSESGATIRTVIQIPLNSIVEFVVPMGPGKLLPVVGTVKGSRAAGTDWEVAIVFDRARPELLALTRPASG